MSTMCNSTPTQWIDNGLLGDIPLNRVNSCWPWQSVTLDEWSSINQKLIASNSLVRLSLIFAFVLCPIGILGSFLCSVAFYRKAFSKKQRFYKWMFAVSILDFVYDLLYTLNTLFKGVLFPSLKTYAYTSNTILSWLTGLIVGCSLASDTCTLCLTIERLICLKKKDYSEVGGRTLTIFEVASVAGMGCLRLLIIDVQYVVREIGTDADGYKKYGISIDEQIVQSRVWNAFQLAINTVTPFILFFLMICLTSAIGIIVYKRRLNRIFDKKSTKQQQQETKQASQIIRLCFCLCFLNVCSQIGYCSNTIASAMKNLQVVAFSSTYQQLTHTANIYLFMNASLLLLRAGECSSKSLNFFFYCLFTPSFRQEIRQWRCRRKGNAVAGTEAH